MKRSLINEIKLIEKLGPEMGGVFALSDLQVIFKFSNKSSFFRTIKLLLQMEILEKAVNGIYTLKNFSPDILSSRIDPHAYLSMGTVLARNGLIGTTPDYLLSAVKVGRNRNYTTSKLKIQHFGISSHLYFGFNKVNGINIANNEKAFLDVLYYSMKGNKYVFNPLLDIDLKQLNINRCQEYLKSYKNKRFVKFCQGVLNGPT